jgi:hypothetical protein
MGDFNASPESAIAASMINVGNVDVSSDATVAASMGDMGGGRRLGRCHTKRRVIYHLERQGQTRGQRGGNDNLTYLNNTEAKLNSVIKTLKMGGKRYRVTGRKKNRVSRKYYTRRRRTSHHKR